MEKTLKQITRDEFMKNPGRVHSYLNKYGVWNLYCYSGIDRSYMKKTMNLDRETIREWHEVKEETVIKHIRDIL